MERGRLEMRLLLLQVLHNEGKLFLVLLFDLGLLRVVCLAQGLRLEASLLQRPPRVQQRHLALVQLVRLLLLQLIFDLDPVRRIPLL